MNKIKSNIYVKLGAIVALILLLLIPTSMVNNLIEERESTKHEAFNEISNKWAANQTIAGPFISVPFDKFIEERKNDNSVKMVKVRDYLQILPEMLDIQVNINPRKRYRGIYEVVVYESKLLLKGNFNNIDISELGIDPENIHYENATINLGISDLKGLESQVSIRWNKLDLNFNSGVKNSDIVASGIHTKIEKLDLDKLNEFSLNIDVKGSQKIYFMPLGKTTNVNLKSDWSTPSFIGAYLPDSRKIDEDGFSANWNILHLNRNYPQYWTGTYNYLDESVFGVNLLISVDNYKKSNRVVKYAMLFLGLTFLVFFFVEVLKNIFIHPIQYLLVGLGLIVFFTLLVSLSEHLHFNLAYIIATALTLSLISLYSYAILKSKELALLIFSVLLILYIFIFTIIQLESFSLLIGSVGIFLILAVVMYYSRKIDWYDLKLGNTRK